MIDSVDGFQNLAHRGRGFLGMLGFGAVIPKLPVYLHEQAGAFPLLLGMGLCAAAGVLYLPMFGLWAMA